MKFFLNLVIGVVFGIGIVLSGMANPEKVIGFLDWSDQWDPALIFVMAGALVVTTAGYLFILKRSRPLMHSQFHLPHNNMIDKKLITGSIIFGIGWGFSGYCPGPGIANISINAGEAFYFIVSFIFGQIIVKSLIKE